jgi:hypothetical protein
MRLTSDGKLGIGTTTPEKELHVVGDLALGKDENNKKFIFNSSKDNNGDYLQITYDKSDGKLETTQGITLKRGGNVGIGTTDPQAKLDVHGDFYIKGKKPMEYKLYETTTLGVSDPNDYTFKTTYEVSQWIAV